MPSKRSKATDQKYISVAEFRKIKGLRAQVRTELKENEGDTLASLREKFTPQLVNRIRASAKRQKITPCELLQKLLRKA